MKRSEINAVIRNARAFFDDMGFVLPPFADWSADEWRAHARDAREIFDTGLGWDITDFGRGAFARMGLVLFTLRNGRLDDTRYPKPYAEKR